MSDEETDDDREEPKELPLPITPKALPWVHRMSVDDQDEWSSRMRTRYGGEW